MTEAERPLKRGRFIKSLFNLGDFIVLNLAFAVMVLTVPVLAGNPTYMRELWVLVNFCWLPMVIWSLDGEHDRRAITLDRVFRHTVIAVGVHAMLFLSLIAFIHLPPLANRHLILFYGMLMVGLLIFNIVGNYVLKRYRRSGYNFKRVVIVGSGPTAMRLAENLRKDTGYGYRILAFFDSEPHDRFEGGELLPMTALPDFVADRHVEQIFYTLSGQSPDLAMVIKTADDNTADFYYVPQLPRTFRRAFDLHLIGDIPVMSIRNNPLKNLSNRILKRAFDITVSSVFLLFYPLIYIPVAIGIKMSSPGPVYFKQERTGFRGTTFTCLKFRTMRVNKASDSLQATEDDPRKTRFGDFLRRTSIDELPQFINVWRGDMSLVGPRPHMLMHTEEYTRLVDRYMVRHVVKPGITGWAQVNGFRGITDELWKMERRVEHDVWYIENWTFILDLKIMVRTILNALHGEKNAF